VAAVPDVAGRSEADAVADLIEAGLEPGSRSERFSNRVPAGAVIRTTPAAGTMVILGTTVDYVVSAGTRPSPEPRLAPSPSPSPVPVRTARPTPADTIVPDLRGLSVNQAKATLREAGLRLGEQDVRSNRQVPAGQVVRSTPTAGTTVAQGTAVDVVVSRGPRPTVEPIGTSPVSDLPDETPAPTSAAVASESPATEAPSTSSTPAADDTLARIQAAGRLRVNIDPDHAPWSTIGDAGTPTGFDVRVATRIARLLGVDVEFTSFPLEEVVTGLWADRWDIAMGDLVVTDDRSRVLDFTQPMRGTPSASPSPRCQAWP